MPEELEGTTAVAEAAPQSGQESAPTASAPAEGSGGNPAWAELRSNLGDTTFKIIEPHLSKFDQAANQRITSLNQNLKGYSELGDVQTLQQYRALAQSLDSNPVEFFNRLQGALTERGLLEAKAAAAQEEIEAQDGDEDPRFAQLQEQQASIQQMLEQQEMERLTAQQSSVLQNSIASVRQGNPWMGDADEARVVQMAHGHFLSGAATSIEQAMQRAAAEYTEIRNGFLSAPRANDTAPKLSPATGGNPSAASPNLAQASRGDTVNLVTAYLKAASGA